jgi:hypothetical protein
MIHCRISSLRNWKTKVLFTALCCTMLPISTMAAEEFTPANGVGSKALLFTFTGLANLGAAAFNGGVGGKYFFADKMAIRGNLNFTTSREGKPFNGGSTGGTDGYNSGTAFGLGAALEYFLAKTRLSPFVGGGLGISTASTTQKAPAAAGTVQPEIDNAAVAVNGISYIPGFGLNINGLAGAEFFITKEISLALEYQLGYFLTIAADRKDITGTTTTTTKIGNQSTLGFRYGGFVTLAFYF